MKTRYAVVVFLLCSKLSFGQNAAPPSGCDARVLEDPELGHKVTELSEGCPAPFSGQLLSPKLAAELQQEVENAPRELELAVTTTAAWWQNEMAFQVKLKDIDLEAERAKRKVVEDALADAAHWTRSPAFIIGMTVLGVALLSAGTATLYDVVNQPD